MKSVFDVNAVANASQGPVAVQQRIETVLKRNNGACYAEMERMLMGNYSGSAQFDKAYAIDVLLRHDNTDEAGRHIHACMAEQSLNRRQLWTHLNKVLVKIGFIFKQGVLIGTRLEHMPKQSESQALEIIE